MIKKNLQAFELDRFRRLNQATQIITWGFLLFVGLLTWFSVIQLRDPSLIYLILVGTGAFFFVWYRYFPEADFSMKVLIEYLVLTFLVAILVRFTGGLTSYFNFFFYLIILGAVARTNFSNTLVIALGVTLAILSNLAMFWNSPDFGSALQEAGILLINQLLVTVLAIYLTREIENSSRKYYEEVVEVEKIKEQTRLKDEFVFIASHELRAPITTMRGYLELLLKSSGEKLSGETIKVLKILFQDADHLNQLVDDLLNVARIEAGKFTYIPKEFSVNTLVKKVVNGMEAKAKAKKIKLVYEARAELQIKSDQGKVEEILDNLVDNAIKYTPEFGHITVSVTKDDNKAVVSVKDTGLGIPEDFQKHIFEKFSRIEHNQPGMKGTGLGLFIVKQLVDRMNGHIWFESQEGKGSTFAFSFPLASSGD